MQLDTRAVARCRRCPRFSYRLPATARRAGAALSLRAICESDGGTTSDACSSSVASISCAPPETTASGRTRPDRWLCRAEEPECRVCCEAETRDTTFSRRDVHALLARLDPGGRLTPAARTSFRVPTGRRRTPARPARRPGRPWGSRRRRTRQPRACRYLPVRPGRRARSARGLSHCRRYDHASANRTGCECHDELPHDAPSVWDRFLMSSLRGCSSRRTSS
jgi:hypothetical protein